MAVYCYDDSTVNIVVAVATHMPITIILAVCVRDYTQYENGMFNFISCDFVHKIT